MFNDLIKKHGENRPGVLELKVDTKKVLSSGKNRVLILLKLTIKH